MRARVSIIICTFNRCSSLADTLASLQALRMPDQVRWDVLVVDNNSTDETKAVVEQFARNAMVDVRYLFEPTQGLSHARNSGILATDSEYIAFTDDDVIVDQDWLKCVVETFTTNNADCVGGKIVPCWLGERPRWLTDNLLNVLAVLDHGDKALELGLRDDDRTLFGANFAFKRESLVKAGMFDVALGRKGAFGAGEDKEVLQKLKQAEGRVIYNPGAIVFHKVSPERLSKKYFRQWHYAAGNDRAKITRDSRFTVLGIESYLLREFVQTALKLVGSISRLDWNRAFEHELRCILYLSVFKHKWALRRSGGSLSRGL